MGNGRIAGPTFRWRPRHTRFIPISNVGGETGHYDQIDFAKGCCTTRRAEPRKGRVTAAATGPLQCGPSGVLKLLVLLAAAMWSWVAAPGIGPTEQPCQAPLPKMTYTKNTVFHLPVQMEDRTRANLREVCLYVKSGTGDWVRQETGLPGIAHFSYKVPRDGEYWFSLVTIDKAGKMTPADVSQDPPGLRVMVDTQPPVIDVQPWTNPDGDFCIRCQVQDANPDLQSLRATYRDQTGEHAVDCMPGNPNVFKIVGRELLKQPLRISAADLCGNIGSRDVNVREMVIAALQMNKNGAAKVVQTSATFDPQPPVPSAPVDMSRTEVQKPSFPPVPPTARRRASTERGILPCRRPALSQGPNDDAAASYRLRSLPCRRFHRLRVLPKKLRRPRLVFLGPPAGFPSKSLTPHTPPSTIASIRSVPAASARWKST